MGLNPGAGEAVDTPGRDRKARRDPSPAHPWSCQLAHISENTNFFLKFQKSIEVLKSFKPTVPKKSVVANGWKFKKAHSILQKVHELIRFGWSENFSTA